jgi:hypothetical protein
MASEGVKKVELGVKTHALQVPINLIKSEASYSCIVSIRYSYTLHNNRALIDAPLFIISFFFFSSGNNTITWQQRFRATIFVTTIETW